jgi:anti-anti-sigma regulatory factor
MCVREVVERDAVNLVVELSEVEFMGAATVGLIVRAQEFLGLRARSLTLRSPSSCARRVPVVCALGAGRGRA